MTPAIIADSDEEDGYESATEAPIEVTKSAVDESRSTNGVSHPSDSTDPALFQSVFHEQLQAAGEHARKSAEVQDQIYARGQDASLWDVPSSPEATTSTKGRKKSAQPANNARTKITRGLRRQLDDIGYVSEDEDTATREEDTVRDREIAMGSRKRRRLGSPANPSTDTNELPSTLPIDSQGSFLVAPAALSTSQKQQYEAVTTAMSSPPTQPGALPLGQRCLNLASSGSATNVNSPRTDATKSSYMKSSPGGTQTQSNKAVKSSLGRQQKQASLEVDEEQGDDYIPKEQENDENEEQGPEEDEFQKPEPPKKRRGRPKKSEAKATKEEPEQMAEKPKRKRGRPKKSEAVVPLEAEEEEKAEEPRLVIALEAHDVEDELQTVKAEDGDAKTAKRAHGSADDTASAKIREADKENKGKGDDGALHRKDVPTNELSKAKASRPVSVGDTGRPLYRVGLSKRTRIAPLLKMIRK